MSPQYALDIVNMLEAVVCDIAKVTKERHADLNKVGTCILCDTPTIPIAHLAEHGHTNQYGYCNTMAPSAYGMPDSKR